MHPKTTVVEELRPIIHGLLGEDFPLRLRAWDGSESGPVDSLATLVLHTPRALRRFLWSPDELGLGRAYVSGDMDIEGDIYAALSLPDLLSSEDRPNLTLDWRERAGAIRTALRLRAVGSNPAAPQEESRLNGRLHALRRDAAAIAHHYDVGNDFYRLVLGETMTYSCAYWSEPDCTLDQAQEAKYALIVRKLGLHGGMRLLDVGCGWGGMVLHAAREHGVHAVGVTISTAQAERARQRVVEAGLSHLVEIRLQDYREVADGPYDAISSIGMAEHVGQAQLQVYAQQMHSLLKPGGRLLNHAISRRPGPVMDPKRSFLVRYVFPDGELHPWRPLWTHSRRPGWRCVTWSRCASTTRAPAGPGCSAWMTTGTRRWRCPPRAEHGSGGCTWRHRPWRSSSCGRG